MVMRRASHVRIKEEGCSETGSYPRPAFRPGHNEPTYPRQYDDPAPVRSNQMSAQGQLPNFSDLITRFNQHELNPLVRAQTYTSQTFLGLDPELDEDSPTETMLEGDATSHRIPELSPYAGPAEQATYNALVEHRQEHYRRCQRCASTDSSEQGESRSRRDSSPQRVTTGRITKKQSNQKVSSRRRSEPAKKRERVVQDPKKANKEKVAREGRKQKRVWVANRVEARGFPFKTKLNSNNSDNSGLKYTKDEVLEGTKWCMEKDDADLAKKDRQLEALRELLEEKEREIEELHKYIGQQYARSQAPQCEGESKVARYCTPASMSSLSGPSSPQPEARTRARI